MGAATVWMGAATVWMGAATVWMGAASAGSGSALACFALGLGRSLPWPLKNTAPKGGIRMDTEDSLPWEGVQLTLQGSALVTPVPP